MDQDIYYKYKEIIDKIILARLNGSIKIIDNMMYFKYETDNTLYPYGHRNCSTILTELNILFKNIEDEELYFKLLSGKIYNNFRMINPIEIYNYYNIKKLNKENKELKEMIKKFNLD